VKFEVLEAASMKMAVFWVAVPCSPVEIYRLLSTEITHLGTALDKMAALYNLLAKGMALKIEAAKTSDTSAIFFQTTRRNNSEDSHLV
jgi:hypothetical protein